MQRKVNPSRTSFSGIAFTIKVLFPYFVIAATPEKRLRGEIREKYHLQRHSDNMKKQSCCNGHTRQRTQSDPQSHGGPVKGKIQQHNTFKRPFTFTWQHYTNSIWKIIFIIYTGARAPASYRQSFWSLNFIQLRKSRQIIRGSAQIDIQCPCSGPARDPAALLPWWN